MGTVSLEKPTHLLVEACLVHVGASATERERERERERVCVCVVGVGSGRYGNKGCLKVV